MIKVELTLTEEVYRDLVMVAEACSRADQRRDGASTHGSTDFRQYTIAKPAL
ncbi:hypothetical protein [Caballeronia sp. GaOx3]|uniref:hypothetical protein n=1 Tax=Caballeronia sp. GaOx3 TaxID=2921740 RepID=UPI00202827A5|nr:hypothetical protein [Caballeronia sp. GaOx3]